MMIDKSIPRVSIILPVYNGGDTLLSSVQSIVNQDYVDWELLILDDGSTDDGLHSLSQLDDVRIKIISDGRRKGLAYRLNEGIDISSGIYLARMDADDLAFPNRLSLQVSFMELHPEIDLLGSRALAFSLAKNLKIFGLLPYRKTHKELTDSPWRGIYLPHPTWLGRVEWFRKHRYLKPEVLRAEDQELLLRAMSQSHYYCLPEVLLAYRIGGFNLRKSIFSRLELFKAQTNIFLAHKELLYIAKAFFYLFQGYVRDIFRKIFPSIFALKFTGDGRIPEHVQYQFDGLLTTIKNVKRDEASDCHLIG